MQFIVYIHLSIHGLQQLAFGEWLFSDAKLSTLLPTGLLLCSLCCPQLVGFWFYTVSSY